jgi:hypothetical protein
MGTQTRRQWVESRDARCRRACRPG